MPFNEKYHVYILLCSDDSYYVGVTNNLERRFAEHQTGYNEKAYTYSRLPVRLVWSQGFSDPCSAIAAEKKLKGWTRVKKEALIEGRYELLPELSRKKF